MLLFSKNIGRYVSIKDLPASELIDEYHEVLKHADWEIYDPMIEVLEIEIKSRRGLEHVIKHA